MYDQSRGVAGRDWSRRDFTRAVVGASSLAVLGLREVASATESRWDSLLGRFCRSLSPDQRRAIQFPSDDPKQTSVQNHWAVVPAPIASLTANQQELALCLIREVCTPNGFAALTRARDDDAGGWKHDHLAVFGAPDEPGRFEWVLSGRHLTLRGSFTGVVTGGPLFFGHSRPGPDNIWWDLGDGAGALFQSLDAHQQDRASVSAGHSRASGSGLDLDELHPDQQAYVRRLLASLGETFRALEVSSIQACLSEGNGLTGISWQVFRPETDRVGDPPKIWRLVGPGFAWSFHGEPHIHLWFDSV